MNNLCSKKICNISIEKYKLEYKKYKEIFDELHNICIKIGEPIEGNCFTEHLNIHNKIENLIYKQANHFSLGMISNEIMEIGFNAGHSSLIYLISNLNCNITIFDLCEHKYTLPCFTYLQKKFPNRLKLYQGNSTKTVPQFIKNNPDKTFDLIHIDGCHVANIANQDFYNSYKIAKKIIIWDDTQILWINKLFEDYVRKHLVNELFLHKTKTYEHRICQINKIPKIIMQTSKNKVDNHIINTIDKWCPKWDYYHFIDTEIIEFFKKNQLKEFPNIIEKFNSFQRGQHKADLFRYYFLYIKGGVFLDSDATFETHIDKIIKNYIFVSVKTFMDKNYIFNGFIATQPKNLIIYEALKHAYNIDNTILNKPGNGPYGLQHYHYFCEELWRIYHRLKLPNCKIYQEVNKSHEGYGGSIIIDDDKKKIISHYWKSKKIPINNQIIKPTIVLVDSIKQYIPKNRNILEIKKNKNASTVIYPENISKESKTFIFETQKDKKLIDKGFVDIGFIYFDIQEINYKLFSDIKEIIRRNRPNIFLRNYQLYRSTLKFNIPKYCVTELGNYIYKKNINSEDLLLIPVHYFTE